MWYSFHQVKVVVIVILVKSSRLVQSSIKYYYYYYVYPHTARISGAYCPSTTPNTFQTSRPTSEHKHDRSQWTSQEHDGHFLVMFSDSHKKD